MAITTMTLAKALVVAKAGLAAAAAALALSACGATVGAPGPQATSAAAPLPTLAAAPARRHLLAAGSGAALFGLDYRVGYQDVRIQKFYTPAWTEMRARGPFRHKAETRYLPVDHGWVTVKAFSGEGGLEDLGNGRLLYVVPEGRVLVVNRVVTPERVTINGYNLAGVAGNDVYFVFGPGESVLFGFPTGSEAADVVACAAKVQGYTADPALLGGAGGLGPGAK